MGNPVFLVQVAGVFPVVAAWVVVRLKTPACHVEPFQYKVSASRRRVNVIELAFSPTPPVLSAAFPVNVVGTAPAW